MSSSQRTIIAALSITIALVGCGSNHDKKDQQTTPLYILYSPNGEPLNGGPLGKPSCEVALGGWFDRISAAHNKLIPQDVFVSDAQAQFVRMDIDHNGYIVSEELDRFREPYRQQAPLQKEEAGKKQSRGHKEESSAKDHNSAAQTDATLFDPVMSADANLDFKVTPEEFLKQAHDNFVKLDANHDGFLDRAEIIASCPKQPEN